jgi:selenocysteine lyase/cysteine desulfurase
MNQFLINKKYNHSSLVIYHSSLIINYMLPCQKHLFSLEEGFHYINGAYMSPLLKSVEEAGYVGMQRKVRPYRLTDKDFFTESDILRRLFAQLIHVPEPNRIALIPSASYGMGIVTNNIKVKRGQNIVVAEAQFPSNVYPWQRLAQEKGLKIKTVAYPDLKNNRGKTWNQHILEAIDNQTVVVALAHVHWANGTKFDLEKIGERAREVRAYLIIDGTQSVGAMPFDVQKIQPDALICAGYKWLLGPYQSGYAYFNEKFDTGKPIEENWITRKDSEDFKGLVNYKDEYQPLAVRFDAGERSNFINVPMNIAALKQLIEWGSDNIQDYCRRLTEGVIPKWREHGFWVEDSDWRSHHLFGVQLPPYIPIELLQQKLKEKNISVSLRGDFVRISPNVYNVSADILALSEVLFSF